MAIPEEDRSKFPVATATELADEFERMASLLDLANGQRARAGQATPDFKGAFAEMYQADLAGHLNHVTDIISDFRATAGALRDAIEEHRVRASSELGVA